MSSDTLYTVLSILAAVLVAGCTGLQIRTVGRSVHTGSVSGQLPLLSMAAALFSGLALAVLGLVAAIEQWPALAQLIGGPLAAVYGLAWFNTAIVEARADAVPASGEQLSPDEASRPTSGTIAALMQLGFSAQFGLLLIALGFRGALDLWVAGVLALCVAATDLTAGLERWLRPLELRYVWRCLAGALLFALGVGSIIRLATHQRADRGFAAAFVAGALCSVGLAVLYRLRRRYRAWRDSSGALIAPGTREGGKSGSRGAPRF